MNVKKCYITKVIVEIEIIFLNTKYTYIYENEPLKLKPIIKTERYTRTNESIQKTAII